MKKSVILLGSCALLATMIVTAQQVRAQDWTANTPDSIQVVNGQKEYTMKKGDTLWAIGQKVNIKDQKLAEINGIDLSKGQQYTLPVGRVLSFGDNLITVKDADGSIYSQTVVGNEDKINQNQPIGESANNTDSNQYPYAVAREQLSYPATFMPNVINMPYSITLDFSEGNNGTVTFKGTADTRPEVYVATLQTIDTKSIRVYSSEQSGQSGIRTVNVNSEILVQPNEANPNGMLQNQPTTFYLFVNSAGSISLATPNYAGNFDAGEADVMVEILQGVTAGSNDPSDGSFVGYTDEQIEYARVTEALLHYYALTGQPTTITIQNNPVGFSAIPYPGSVTLNEASTTLTFSMDGTMADTVSVTYISNHDGSIRFFKNPNHYQDTRYETDPNWVHDESQNLVNSTQTLTISTTYDQQAAQIISLIK